MSMPIERDDDQGGPEPELAEVQQRDENELIVRVKQEGPIDTRQLPRRLVSCRSLAGFVTGQDPQLLTGNDPRRYRVYLSVATGTLYVGSRADCSGGSGFVLSSTLELTHRDPIYIAWASATPVLSVLIEAWAD